MNRKTIVVAAAAGTLAIAAGTAWAVDTDVTPASVAATATPTTSSTTTPTTSSASSATVLSADDAARLVRARLGGGVVHEVEAEFEHGRPEWKVEITKGGVAYEIRVDAKTGAVTRFETRDGDARPGRDDDDGIDDRGRHGGHGADDGAGDDHGGRHGGDDRDDDHGGHGGDDGPGDDHGGDR
jgi:uncharacterized membrane protein YkoI